MDFLTVAQAEYQSTFRKLGKPVSQDETGMRLDLFCAKKFLFFSREKWNENIRSGKILVDGQKKKPSSKLALGQQIAYYNPIENEPDVDLDVQVLWRDGDVAAVMKPSGLPMHEGGLYRFHTLDYVLGEVLGPEWGFTHRLDRETSGIVLCARTQELRNELAVQFREKTIAKTYFAVAMGSSREDEFFVDAPLGTQETSLQRTKQWVVDGAAESQTAFFVRKREASGRFVFLEVHPKTGRTHQIRVHAAYSGLPLVGDKRYCGDDTIFGEYMDNGFTERVRKHCLFERLCLHAGSIRFRHPIHGKTVTVNSPVPRDMVAIWDTLSAASIKQESEVGGCVAASGNSSGLKELFMRSAGSADDR